MEALEMALASGSRPEIFHSDQGCHFTSAGYVAKLQTEDIKISWSSRRRCYDNILVERLWRTLKYVAADFSAKPSRGLSPCL
jgi:putative transposase